MSYLERLRARVLEKPLPSEPTEPTKPGFVSFVGGSGRRFSEYFPAQATLDVPPEIIAGLDRLTAEPPPLISNPPIWKEIVADARRLVSEGWAARALALGWTAKELFGASAEVGGDSWFDGAAVWLGARQIAMVDDRVLMAVEGRSRVAFHRFDASSAAFLWELRDIQRNRMKGGAVDD